MRTLASPEDRPIPSIGDSTAWRLIILAGTLILAGLVSLGSGPANLSSTGVRGATNEVSSAGLVSSGGGKARRSTLPVAVRGKVSSVTNVEGTM